MKKLLGTRYQTWASFIQNVCTNHRVIPPTSDSDQDLPKAGSIAATLHGTNF